ncbi:hypothetical protein GCM10023189_37230 [Nibrella saemangeumensis]|uniref:Uncharacterized protein n=1 Tax=Nibrella saemangeumensis TaxID=1084526 RepID=A0ABP8N780_9BACT
MCRVAGDRQHAGGQRFQPNETKCVKVSGTFVSVNLYARHQHMGALGEPNKQYFHFDVAGDKLNAHAGWFRIPFRRFGRQGERTKGQIFKIKANYVR